MSCLIYGYKNTTSRGSDTDKNRRQWWRIFARDLAQYFASNGIPALHIWVAPKLTNDSPTNRGPSADPEFSLIEDWESGPRKEVTVIRTEYSSYMVCANQDWVTTDGSGRYAL